MSPESDTEKKILHTVRQPETPNVEDPVPDFLFWCPGCKFGHAVWTTKKNRVGAQWSFNGNMEKPSFDPSILGLKTVNHPRCHLFVRNGMLEFCGDCEHEFAGKTIPMEPF